MLSTRHTSADGRSKIEPFCKQNVKIVEFHDNIWNHHEKYIQIRTNILSIDLVIHEIGIVM